MSRNRAAFTLLELMLAIAITIVVMLVAIPSVRGLVAERRLRDTFEKFDALARKAQLHAVTQQRTWALRIDEGGVAISADEPLPEEHSGSEDNATPEQISSSKDESYTMLRPASLLLPKDTPSKWTFWRSGTCEPAIVNYTGPDGTWAAQYNPLTGHGEITDQQVR